MSIVTTTHYVPDREGWSNRGFYFRIKVVQDYDNVANQSTLTVSLESYHASYSGTFNFLADSYIKVDGDTLTTLGTSYKITYDASTTWKQIKSSGGPNEWAYTVNHDISGNAAVNFETAGRMYLYTGGTDYYGDMDNTMSYTFTGVRAFSLSISAGDGSIITVKRSGTSLSNGATIYYGDVLKISFSAGTGYNLTSHTVNGSSFTSGNTLTVSAAVSVSATATLKSYTLTISSDGHAEVTVKRGSTALNSGDSISHFDVLTVTVSPKSGWKISAADINGTSISPETAVSHTVSGPVTVTVTTAALSNVFIDADGGKKRVLVIIDDNGERKIYRAVFR